MLKQAQDAGKLDGSELEKKVAALKTTLGPAAISTNVKAKINDELAVLSKKILEQQKAAASANKGKAIELAMEAADEAV